MLFIRTLLFFSLFISGLSVLHGCKQEPEHNTNDLYLAYPDSILSSHNASRPDWDQAIKTEGWVNFISRDKRIEIRHVPEQGNEIISYFLQHDEQHETFDSVVIKRAEVIFLGRGLLVNSLMKKETKYFYLGTDDVPALIKGIGKVKTYKGFGLGERKITLGSKSNLPPYCACDHSYTPPGNCKAGQNMELHCASANDYGSCRVTCTGQTYACCDRGFE